MMKFRFQRKQLCIPYALFLIMFVVLPLLLIVYYAFTDSDGAFTLSNFINFFGNDGSSVKTLLVSAMIALGTTALCLLIGYPLAYLLSNSKYNKNSILVMLFIMPMWINFVLRTAALRELLTLMGMTGSRYGVINTLIGMTYNYLPFMILPLYTTMCKMDKSVIEAAHDLGANNSQVFWKVIVPMSMPGVVSGVTMVFMPTMTCFVISDIMSERSIEVFGKLIERNFQSGDWHFGTALSMIMLLIIGASMLISAKTGAPDNAAAVRGGLW